MDKQLESPPALKITREEMLYLMDFFKAHFLIGFNRETMTKELDSFLQKGNRNEIAKSLMTKNILKSKSPHTFEINPDIQSVVDTLLFPERVLVVVRYISNHGNQVFYVMEKGKSLVLHSFPKGREHFIQPFSQSINLFLFLLNWLPLSRLPLSATRFDIPKDLLLQVQSITENGKMEEALNLLQSKTLESGEMKSFFHALSEPKISGSIGWVSFPDGKAGGFAFRGKRRADRMVDLGYETDRSGRTTAEHPPNRSRLSGGDRRFCGAVHRRKTAEATSRCFG
jgi:hypothetical protein